MINAKNYIISERVKYLILGLIAGFFIGISGEPYNYALIVGFVIVGFILYYWNKKKVGVIGMPGGKNGRKNL